MTYLASINGSENPIDANYHLFQFQCPTRCITFYELIKFLKLPRQNPEHLLLIDELPGWCDSYVPSEKGARFATHFLNQAQKLGYDLIFTSQRRMRANINFRELSDLAFKAEKNQLCSLKKCKGLTCEYVDVCNFTYKVLDPDNTEEDIETGKKITIPFRLAIEEVFGRFDTWEAVPPVGLDDVLNELRNHDPVALNKEVNRQVSVLREAYPSLRGGTIPQISELLLDIGEHIKHSGLVCARLNRQTHNTPQISPKIVTPKTETQQTPQNYIEKWITAQNQKRATSN